MRSVSRYKYALKCAYEITKQLILVIFMADPKHSRHCSKYEKLRKLPINGVTIITTSYVESGSFHIFCCLIFSFAVLSIYWSYIFLIYPQVFPPVFTTVILSVSPYDSFPIIMHLSTGVVLEALLLAFTTPSTLALSPNNTLLVSTNTMKSHFSMLAWHLPCVTST